MSDTHFMTDDEIAQEQQLIEEVEHFEQISTEAQSFKSGGRVINEWYSMPEYVKRRHGLLGRHPDYKDLPKLGQSTMWDGDMVFGRDPYAKLSVQEIRRRELEFDIVPLLPLPTTVNTQTLDDFAAYPTEEWQPGVEIPTIIISSPFATLSAPVLRKTASQSPIETSGDLLDPALQSNNLATTTPSTTAGPADAQFASDMPGQVSESQNFYGQGGSVFPQQTAQASFLAPSNFNTTNTATDSSSPYSPTNIMATLLGPVYNPAAARNVPKDQLTLLKIIDDLAKAGSLRPSDAPAEYRQRWTDASSLAGRPVESPVKTPPRGKKRAAPEDDATVAGTPRPDSTMPESSTSNQPTADASSEAEQKTPVAKKPKLIIKPPTPPRVANGASPKLILKPPTPPKIPSAAPEKAPPSRQKKKKTSATTSSPVRRSSKAAGKQPQRTTSPTASSSTPAAAITSTPQPNTVLDRIARGEILPKTKTLAISAAAHRLTLLRAAHAKTSRAHHPDFPPEFFDRANFSKDDLAKQNVVRCLCGDTKDDKNPSRGREWVGCDNDECAVWQHVDCIGEAVPKDLENDEYLCHACDPFRHRKALKEVRKAAGSLP